MRRRSPGVATPEVETRNNSTLVPYFFLDRGRAMRPVPGGYVPLRGPRGQEADTFEVVDRLLERFGRLYVVDLEGVSRNRPQLDYLQEISRSGEVWVEGGVRKADQVIDILVTGARRAVVSTAYLLGPKELRGAWRLSQDLMFELDVEDGRIRPRGNDWDHQDPVRVAREARTVGFSEIVLTTHEGPVDWVLARTLAADGPLWVAGGFLQPEAGRLQEVGAVGGIFATNGELLQEIGPST